MDKERNVVEFYFLCNKLKNILRKGWLVWGVQADRAESVAEHVFGTQMLAMSMWSEYKYNLDIKKVLCMLAVHETEEILIGDLTLFDVSKEQKQELGRQAVQKVFGHLENCQYFTELVDEFDAKQTKEAKFAFECDKLECDIQCKLYDEKNLVDLTKQENNPIFNNPLVQDAINKEKTWSGAWLRFGKMQYNYDENFLKVSDFVKNNTISKDKDLKL